jgi:chromosome segregation ATPase
MDKRLLEQVQKALQAQQDTIKRQEQMLDDQEHYVKLMLDKKDRDIAELTASLNKLAQTKTQELERLPTLFKQLQSSMTEQTGVFNGWMAHRKNHVTTQATLVSELLALGNVQIQLVEQLKTYQSTITPPDYLESDTTQLENDTVRLEGELSALASAQSKIEQSQAKITGSQTGIQAELKELNTLLDKLEK